MSKAPGGAFGGSSESVPSVSFKDAAVGTTVSGTVTTVPEIVHSVDFDSRQKQYWDPQNRGKKTTVPNDQPVWAAVVHIEVDGEERAVWAQKPSALFRAINDAQNAAGVEIAPGGTLAITYTGEKANPEKPHLHPAKQYTAVYTPPANGGAFGADQAAAPAAPAPEAPAAAPQAPAAAPAKKTVTAEQYAALANAGVDVSAFEIG